PAPERVRLHRRLHLLDGVLHLVAVLPRGDGNAGCGDAHGAERPGDGGAEGARPPASLASRVVLAGELDLDLETFEGPLDLLLTLLLKEELSLAEIDVAEIVIAFAARLADEGRLDLEACGEFLVLVGALLELKARELFPDQESDLSELRPEEAAEELARRL